MFDNDILSHDKTWQLIKSKLLEKLKDCDNQMYNSKNSHEQLLRYQGQGLLLKELLNLPELLKVLADTKSNKGHF